jgi:hypothetical protein
MRKLNAITTVKKLPEEETLFKKLPSVRWDGNILLKFKNEQTPAIECEKLMLCVSMPIMIRNSDVVALWQNMQTPACHVFYLSG